MRTKVCVIGHFGGNKVFLDGQTIKTKMLTKELKKQLGENSVSILDTHGGKKALIKCFFKAFSALKNSDSIIMMPAHNGVRFFVPVLMFWNVLFRRKLHYSVIGGWLPELVAKKKLLRYLLKKFHNIYVETDTMKRNLQEQGFSNVSVVPNCKELTPLSVDELEYCASEPYRLCTFSRVNRLKGIETAAKVIEDINTRFGRTVYEMDIYGRVDSGEEEWFESFIDNSPIYIKYCGQVSPEKSVDVIRNYFALLFPTHYYTEGIPGTIIDAYAAGVPVIAAKWQSFDDVIDDGITGIGYKFDDIEDFKQKLLEIMLEKDRFDLLKISCINKSEHYLPSVALKPIVDNVR